MRFRESISITEGVNNATEIERIREVAMEAEEIEKAKGFLDIAVFSAEIVDYFGPVLCIGDWFL